MQLVHIVATAGSIIISGCMGSMGALMVALSKGSLHKQTHIPMKPGGGAISCTSLGDLGGDMGSNSTVCRHSSAL